jgi:hypothetical protein
MAAPLRAEVLLQPEEYRRLTRIADAQGVSLSDLIRTTLAEHFAPVAPSPQEALEEILRLQISLGDWETLEEEIAEAHGRLS